MSCRSRRCIRSLAAAGPTGLVSSDPRLAALQACTVMTLEGQPQTFSDLWSPSPDKLTLLLFFTHWADLGSWELAQRINKRWSDLAEAGVDVVAVGLGSSAAGTEFARLTGYPSEKLYADPASACCKALGFSPGFLPGSDINGYAKIFPMLAGIGSPGTMQEVFRGYVGDKKSEPLYNDTRLGAAFDVLGKGYQRPFELATLRLTNMAGSISNCAPYAGSKLAPDDTQQLVQQGGSLLMKGDAIVFEHQDTGILITTDMKELFQALEGVLASN